MSEHFNSLSPAEVERLALLMEECGEVIQVIGKVLRHGYASYHPDTGKTNREDLERELGDLWAACSLMTGAGDISLSKVCDSKQAKLSSVGRWLHHNRVGAVS